ncbi:MAG TPA: citrate synthase family protein [Vicinamibacterales bacterium]|nr:citrate synthase family protein [Vicinamibacterales bacterium]
MSAPSWMDAAEAAARLRVSRATLYAYVSRGLIRSQAIPGASRQRAYARDDVERLRRRTEERRDPDKAAARALHWGIPVLESSITLIDGRRLYYRGHDVLDLARSRSVAEVASLIWTGRFDGARPGVRSTAHDREIGRRTGLTFVARAQIALARAAARDAQAFDLRPEAVIACGWRILDRLATAAAASPVAAPTIDRILARGWRVGARAADVLRSAVILCADHELNVSAFTARAVASAGSGPYAVVIAGLAALEGTRHGGASARVASMLASMRGTRRLDDAIAARLRRGEPIGGFGHPLYPDGDPRAAFLLARLAEGWRGSRELSFVRAFAEAASRAIRERPNLDFALAAVARVLRLPAEAPPSVFGVGRTIGWIGHALEQYGTGQLIRPRARYVGAVPALSVSP